MEDVDKKLEHRTRTSPDAKPFCQRVSEALSDRYVLYESRAATFDGERVIVAQAPALGRAR
jgi:hypothetical protein